MSNMLYETEDSDLHALGDVAEHWVATISLFFLMAGMGFLVSGAIASAIDVRRTMLMYASCMWIGQVRSIPIPMYEPSGPTPIMV